MSSFLTFDILAYINTIRSITVAIFHIIKNDRGLQHHLAILTARVHSAALYLDYKMSRYIHASHSQDFRVGNSCHYTRLPPI